MSRLITGSGLLVAILVCLGLVLIGPSPGNSSAPARNRPQHQISPSAAAERVAMAEAMLERARALTPTEVILDERAAEHWLPLLGELRRRQHDPSAPIREREALRATLRRLAELGL